jgi:hypothetical protein
LTRKKERRKTKTFLSLLKTQTIQMESLQGKTVVELRELAKAQGYPYSGKTKNELVKMLHEGGPKKGAAKRPGRKPTPPKQVSPYKGTREELAVMTNDQLKELLGARGLPKTGNKSELTERLITGVYTPKPRAPRKTTAKGTRKTVSKRGTSGRKTVSSRTRNVYTQEALDRRPYSDIASLARRFDLETKGGKPKMIPAILAEHEAGRRPRRAGSRRSRVAEK